MVLVLVVGIKGEPAYKDSLSNACDSVPLRSFLRPKNDRPPDDWRDFASPAENIVVQPDGGRPPRPCEGLSVGAASPSGAGFDRSIKDDLSVLPYP